MKSKTLKRREGFWASKQSPDLPWPRASDDPFRGKEKFLKRLTIAESKARVIHYKGWSSCRLCICHRNGSTEFELDGWVWPVGLRHYIEYHNVRPSLAFQEFILRQYIDEE